MAYRMGYYIALVFVLCCAMLAASEASYIPKPAGFSVEALKRSVASGARQKRYTDYQERASAFCTGLCMYEERKSYSECFDLCNWNYQQEPSYSANTYYEPIPESYSPQDKDYANDGVPETDMQRNRQNKNKDKARNGRKGRNKALKEQKQKNREELARQKQILKELKRKLMQEIDEKKHQLTDKAVNLEQNIRLVEEEMELNKQKMLDMEDKLETIGEEMSKIDELKTNLSTLVKDRRKVLLGKLQDPSDGITNTFLLPEGKLTEDGNLSSVIKDFLVQDKTKRARLGSNQEMAMYGSSEQPFELYENIGGPLPVENHAVLQYAASNLAELMEDVPGSDNRHTS